MVELIVTGAVLLLAAAAEGLHAARVRRVARLAFGPAGHPAAWARFAGAMRVASCGALAWGLTALLLMDPKIHRNADEIPENEKKHLLLVLDVSPSMRLVDAGPEGKQSRMQRARDVLDKMFGRIGLRQYLVTAIATYNGAIPIVEKSRDPEVVRNVLNDLPLHYAFKKGDTDLFAGLEEAARISRPWRPRSATLLMVTDGDTIPPTGMPKLPASVGPRLIIGIGNTREGKFIDGRHSRQEASTLRQLAIRLGGAYQDANENYVSSDLLRTLAQSGDASDVDQLTKREFALLATLLGSLVLAFLPLSLEKFGTRWRPGAKPAVQIKGLTESGKSMATSRRREARTA